MAVEYGQKLNALTSLDSGSGVAAGGSTNGTTKDIGANTSPQATMVVAEFGLTQSGSTDAADLEIKVQHSDDDATWPDNDQGAPIFSWVAASAGADLTRSEIVSFQPKLRYFRFRYTNNNGTDSFTVNSAVALQSLQDNSA